MNDSAERLIKIALIGNPNSGKSTVFNQLTGLRQKTGNFPGITVDIKEGNMQLPDGREAMLIDFPGTYSLYPTSSDEKLVSTVLANPKDKYFPDAIVYIADVTNLEKHLLLLTQLLDLGMPIIMAMNMSDTAASMGIKVNTSKIAEALDIPVVLISGRTGDNISKLKLEIERFANNASVKPRRPVYKLNSIEKQVAEAVCLNLNVENPYRALQLAHHHKWFPFLHPNEKAVLATIVQTKDFQSLRAQVDETPRPFRPVYADCARHHTQAAFFPQHTYRSN
jgi:ferrous iron transport protein B